MTGPSIAVATVCLNDIDGLKRTFESVVMQSASPRQWIVADGQSNDGTQAWLDAVDCPLLDWSSAKDGGIYQGMNAALHRVTADYVVFMNSGDVFSGPDVLRDVATCLEGRSEAPALLYGDCFEVHADGRADLRRARPAWWVWLGMPTTHQAMYFRVDRFRDGFDTRYRWSGDYEAVCRLYLANRGKDICHLPQPLCRYHLGGRSDQNRREFLRENLEIRRRVLGMGTLPAHILHAAHHVQGWVKRYLPAAHRMMRYG